MIPGQQIHRLLADVPRYESDDIVVLLPCVAVPQTAHHARILALRYQATRPDTDYLPKTVQLAERLGTSVKRVGENLEWLPSRCEIG